MPEENFGKLWFNKNEAEERQSRKLIEKAVNATSADSLSGLMESMKLSGKPDEIKERMAEMKKKAEAIDILLKDTAYLYVDRSPEEKQKEVQALKDKSTELWSAYHKISDLLEESGDERELN